MNASKLAIEMSHFEAAVIATWARANCAQALRALDGGYDGSGALGRSASVPQSLYEAIESAQGEEGRNGEPSGVEATAGPVVASDRV
jgi:hypothetical protein